jgi:drug/metabolite transporter (DMT)-like permease
VSAAARLPTPAVLGVAMLTAGVVYPVTGAALHATTPITIAVVRALGGGLLLLVLLPALGSRLPRTRRGWTWALAIGFANTTLTLVGISEGTDRAGAAVASVLLNSSPFFVALLARGMLAERISRLRAVGLGVGFAGVLGVVLADPGDVAHGGRLLTGFGLALLGALGWAAAGLAMRALSLREAVLDVPGMTAAQFLCGGVLLLPLLPLEHGGTQWSRPSLAAELVFLAVGGQLVVYLAFNVALDRWPATRVYAWTFLVPAVAVLIEAARGSLPGPFGLAGIVAVIAGVAIVNHPRAEAVGTSTGRETY